jgi:hypothetical protein
MTFPEEIADKPAATEPEPKEVENPEGAGRSASSVYTPPDESVEASDPKVKVTTEGIASFEWHGMTVTTEPTTVPAAKAGPLISAAREVGVTLALEE